ncbi:MAG TPA: DUF5995 family protein [Blastocatellia bacterium]|nr:DUF5995 family protein [Blastocatellia bacterium]
MMMGENLTDPTVDERLAILLGSASVDTVDDVIALMREIDALLPDDDGLKWFNLLYLKVTEAVKDNPTAGGWEDPRWLERLDVLFARLYFDAVAGWQRDREESARAWRPLLDCRRRGGVARIQFALAGMNAHINHDLAIAVVQTGEEQTITPRRGSPQHRDFERVNALLEIVEEEAKQFLVTGIIGEIDHNLGRLDDLVALWKIGKARDTAWTNAEILWQLHPSPTLKKKFLLNLGRLVGLSSKGLLVPTG